MGRRAAANSELQSRHLRIVRLRLESELVLAISYGHLRQAPVATDTDPKHRLHKMTRMERLHWLSSMHHVPDSHSIPLNDCHQCIMHLIANLEQQ